MSSKSDRDNRSNQLNPNNCAYSSSRAWASEDDDCYEIVHSASFSSGVSQTPTPISVCHRANVQLDIVYSDGETGNHILAVEVERTYLSIRDVVNALDAVRTKIGQSLKFIANDVADLKSGKKIAYADVRSCDDAAGWSVSWDGTQYLKKDVNWATEKTKLLNEREFAEDVAKLAATLKKTRARTLDSSVERTAITIRFPEEGGHHLGWG